MAFCKIFIGGVNCITLVNDDNTLYERPVDKFIYDPCRVDFNTLKDLAK